MVKTLVTTFGSRGDVQPMLALAQSLTAAGHEVSFCAPPENRAWAESLGLRFFPAGTDVQAFLQAHAHRITREPRSLLKLLIEQLEKEVISQFEGMPAAIEGQQLVVGAAVQTAGASFAELHRVPYRYVAYCPMLLPSDAHPPPTVPLFGLPAFANRLLWGAHRGLLHRAIAKVANARRQALGLGPVARLWEHMLTDDEILLACDPLLGPLPALQQGLRARQVGAFFLDDPGSLEPALEEFLAAGPAPIYFGFGSMPDQKPGDTVGQILEAVRSVGARAIVSRGWAGLEASSAKDVYTAGPMPHAKLFPRLAAVVHHGGAGTTHAAARAGVPQILVPHMLDQFYWARRVEELQLGPRQVPRSRFGVRTLGAALQAVLRDDFYARSARALQPTLRDGRAETVRVLQSLLPGR